MLLPFRLRLHSRNTRSPYRPDSHYFDCPRLILFSEDRDCKVTKTDYYLSNALPQTPLQELCRVARAEHRAEECFQRAKGQAGLADYEVRHWIGWQHHQTLSLMACWFLTQETQRAKKKTPATTLCQVQQGMASVLRLMWAFDSIPVLRYRIEQRLLRNQLAKLYHWKRRNKPPPTNLQRRTM